MVPVWLLSRWHRSLWIWYFLSWLNYSEYASSFQEVLIDIDRLAIEFGPACGFDALEISWDGSHHTLCDGIVDNIPCSFVADAGPILVTFRTDGSVTRSGFSLMYAIVEAGTQATCNILHENGPGASSPPFIDYTTPDWEQPTNGPCGEVLTAPSGTIVSPNYPDHYGNNGECAWVINVTQPAVR